MDLSNSTIENIPEIKELILMEYRERYSFFDENYLDSVIELVYKKCGQPSMNIKIEVWKQCIENLS